MLRLSLTNCETCCSVVFICLLYYNSFCSLDAKKVEFATKKVMFLGDVKKKRVETGSVKYSFDFTQTQEAMASRRSHAPTHSRTPIAPCPDGTRYYQKPTASCEAAQLWDKHHLTLSWFRKAGPTIILNIIRDAEPAAHTQSTCCPRLRGYGETP